MCGIFGIHKFKPETDFDFRQLIEKLFINSEVRGQDACGYAFVTADGGLFFNKDPVTPTDYVRQGRVRRIKPEFRILIGHTRHATRGPPANNANNHPLISEKHSFALVHNGVIYSDYYGPQTRRAEVDTEALLLTCEDFMDAGQDFYTAIRNTYEKIRGTASTAWIKHGEGIVLGRRMNPLVFAFLPPLNTLVFASEEKILVQSLEEAGLSQRVKGIFPNFMIKTPADYSIYKIACDTDEITTHDVTMSTSGGSAFGFGDEASTWKIPSDDETDEDEPRYGHYGYGIRKKQKKLKARTII